MLPVTNAWRERGASAVKRVKSRMWSTMKNDLLNSLLHLSINGPSANKEADQILEYVMLIQMKSTRKYHNSTV